MLSGRLRAPVRALGLLAFLLALGGCGGSAAQRTASLLPDAVNVSGTRSAQTIQTGNGASLQTIALPTGTRGIVNGTDEAVYALSSDTTSVYRQPMINGILSTFPLGVTAYPYSLVRGPHTLNTFWFTQRRGPAQSDGVDFIDASGTVVRFASPVPYPTSIVTGQDNLHMYVTGTSCLCQTASVQIGVLNLDGSGQTAYALPLPPNASAQLYDGLALGPDDRMVWFPIRVTSATSDKNELVRFDTTSHTFATYPLLDNHAITGIVTFEGSLAIAEAPNAVVLMTTNGSVTSYALPANITQPVYPILDPSGNLWASALDPGSGHGVFVELLRTGLTFDVFETPAAGNGSLTVGPDNNIWFGSSDPHLYVEVLHALLVSPTSITLAVGGQQTVTATEANPAGTLTPRSYDVKVATVAGSGNAFTVTAVGAGTTQVTIIDQQENVVSIPVTVQGPTTTVLTVNPNPAQPGQDVTLTATVRDGAAKPVSGGSVAFTEGGTTLCSSAITNANGVAVCQISAPAVGPHVLMASLTAFGTYQASVSSQVTLDVAATVAAAHGSIFVSNLGENTITAYAANASGNAAPVATIAGTYTGLNWPIDVALDTAGNVYVANALGNSITVYGAGSNGNATPIATIAGPNTGLFGPEGVALDATGKIYVTSGGSVLVFAPGANGNATPLATISGSNTGLNQPIGVAVDSTGKIYVANITEEISVLDVPSVTVYAPGANGNVAPIATIGGSNTGLDAPFHVAVDASGKVYVANEEGPGSSFLGSLTVYAAGAAGNVAPIEAISGSNTGISEAAGVAVDAAGKIYVSSYGGNDVTIYAPGATGNATPLATISGSTTGLSNSRGIAVR